MCVYIYIYISADIKSRYEFSKAPTLFASRRCPVTIAIAIATTITTTTTTNSIISITKSTTQWDETYITKTDLGVPLINISTTSLWNCVI